ncbi:MAG TPA: hypothetical protein VHM26_08110 [Chitinophagaceae bacterium]|jgi:hypothetical protein|nr:hypothetical protein [Chitinophagaceae bacterium]
MKAMRHLLFIFLLFIGTKIIAQNRFLTIESNTVAVDNVWIHDSIANGRPVFTATMDITLREGPETKTVLTRLQSTLTDGKPVAAQLIAANLNMDVTEERNYNGISVLEMIFSDLNGGDKSVARIRVKFRSSNMSVNYTSKKLSVGLSKSATAVASNFRISIPSKDTRRVAAINNIVIGNNSKQFFTLDLAATDAKPWHDALLKESGKTEQAVIEWLSSNLKDVLFTVTISDAEIVSYSSQSSSNDNLRAFGKVTIGIKARSILIAK